MEIDLGKVPFTMDFHPSDNLVTAGLITGDLHLYRFNADSSPQRLLEIHAHSESCRAARFINDGQAIITGSSDRSILATDLETGSPIARLENAHEDAIFSLINLTESTVASGDDQGCVKVWDTRQRSCCKTFNVHEDYVSDMTFASDSMKLLSTSGDGTLSVCNLRTNKIQSQSEFSEEELLSVVIMKNGRKVICGSQNGTLLLYSWGFFKDCSDRFTALSPNSIDSLLKLDEDRVITGSENGLISLVGILPSRVIQPLAEHSEYPIECLGTVWDTRQRSCCKTFNVHEDYVSDMTFASDSMKLLSTSGDGTLSVCNLRTNKIQSQSEFSEEELLSVVIMKNGRKVICGSQNGTLLLYSWGFFKDCSDRFTALSPNSIDSLLKLDEDRVITGSENGLISLVGILPSRVIQPLAEHSEYPIECLAFSHDRKYLGSISHDQVLKMWDLDDLLQNSGSAQNDQAPVSDSDSDAMNVDTNPPKSRKGAKRKNEHANDATSSFFADL